jgi:hypothetical protein
MTKIMVKLIHNLLRENHKLKEKKQMKMKLTKQIMSN